MKDINSRFLTKEEMYSWDLVANHFFSIENITDEQKVMVRNAFLFLKKECGENYLREIDKNHPMSFHLINYVLSSRLWFVDLAEYIRILQESFNYASLKRRLKNSSKFTEAFSVLETAAKFSKAGYKIEFDPKVKVNDKPKEPDLKIISSVNDESFYCEVSVLNNAVIEVDARNTELKLFEAIMFNPTLQFAGKIERILSVVEIKEVSDKLIKLVGEVEKIGFGELVINNLVKLGLATEDNNKELVNWAKKHNCEVGNFEQPYFESKELQRMKTKINEKRKQLPYERSNLIMIYDNDYFYRCGNLFNVINELEKLLTKYKNVTGVIIRRKVLANIEPLIAKIKQHTYIQKYQYDIYAEQYLVIWNMASEKKFDEETNKRIIDSILFY
jgi:hypothetical protein